LDGTSIAFTVTGSGLPLVWTTLHYTDNDLISPGPASKHWMDALATRHTLIRFDMRGCGLSERAPTRMSLDAWVEDIEAVVNAAGLNRFAMMAVCTGSYAAIEYAARHSERLTHFVIYGGSVRGRLKRDLNAAQREDALSALQVYQSGLDGRSEYSVSFRRIFTVQFLPDASSEQFEAIDQIVSKRMNGTIAAQSVREFYGLDLSARARLITTSCLILHARHDILYPLAEGQRLAALIPGARFVPVESNNNTPLAEEPAWPQARDAVLGFLGNDERAIKYAGTSGLTARQLDVLRHVANGRTDKQIARELSLSPRTIEMHVSGALKALGSKTRAEAAHCAAQRGLL
jgi:pimeloyl-ACP methyl ester carboxylesterase/DNA-binding CsgD family transcriptional regulator